MSEEEKDVLRWGRNAKVTMPKRFVGGKAKDNGPRKGTGGGKAANSSSSSSPAPLNKTVVSGPHANVYRSATALECLVGFLYVTDARRLHAVMRYLGLGGPEDGEGLASAVLSAAKAAAEERRGGKNSSSSGGDDDDGNDDGTSDTTAVALEETKRSRERGEKL